MDQLLGELEVLRSRVREQEIRLKYLESLTKGIDAKIDEKVGDAITTFIAYGVDEQTKGLGAGERAAVLHSYKTAFGKLPETEAEFSDALKIASGRFPDQRSEEAEDRAREQFRRIYIRPDQIDNARDTNAIVIMAYGIRQSSQKRNLVSERRALKTFRRIYKRLPKSTEDWNIIQAITYSGAAR
ncbi:hypothetical protein HY772_10515 [Candidatus Woesearchaeota archaeon]|nr:hypothetical protein [Candidatus Woesearchaeota archaeon]